MPISTSWESADAAPPSVAGEPLRASRQARDHHQFVTVEFSNDHLRQQLADCEGDLDPQLRALREELYSLLAAEPFRSVQTAGRMIECLEGFAQLEVAEGRPERALRLAGAAAVDLLRLADTAIERQDAQREQQPGRRDKNRHPRLVFAPPRSRDRALPRRH